MDALPVRRARQLLLILVVCIDGTLGVMRDVVNALRGANLLRAVVAVIFAGCAALLARVLWRRGFLVRPSTWPVLGGAIIAYALALQHSMTIEESLHLVEYGLVGMLARSSMPRAWTGARAWLGAWLLAVALGWLDEGIQGLLPSRHYDLHDVMLNAAAAGIPLLAAFLLTRVANDDGKSV